MLYETIDHKFREYLKVYGSRENLDLYNRSDFI